MQVDNIFELVNKFSKEEDQISASFGFVLKNNKKILKKFLNKIQINIKPKELKKVDIETQVPYDSGNSIIDLSLTIYNRFLVFIESKLYKNEQKISKQLLKYKDILWTKKAEYDNTMVEIGDTSQFIFSTSDNIIAFPFNAWPDNPSSL